MITKKEFDKAMKTVNDYKLQLEDQLKYINKELIGLGKFAYVHAETKLYDTDCSVRLLNILKSDEDIIGISINFETKVADFSKVSLSDFKKCRRVGIATIKELKELCFFAGVNLKP